MQRPPSTGLAARVLSDFEPRSARSMVGMRSYVEVVKTKWTTADVPDQSGRVAIVTGANSGLGYDTAAVLAAMGAHVVLAVRNLDKGAQAADRIKAASPNAVGILQEL